MESNKNTSFDVYRNLSSLYEVKTLPYIPIPFEEIDAYTKLPDYTTDYIKNINTVGVLNPISLFQMILYSTQENEKRKIKLDTKNLYNGPNFCGSGSDPNKLQMRAVRVFGFLVTQSKGIIIRVHHFSPVENVERCERTLRLMAQVARQKISAYQYDSLTDPEMQHLIDQTKKQKSEEEQVKRSVPLIMQLKDMRLQWIAKMWHRK